MMKPGKEEILGIVDAKNRVRGRAAISHIYKKKLPHRIVHVFVMHPRTSEIYLQRRSMKKSYLPGYYCTSAGGHVRYREKIEEAAKRELNEELGLKCNVQYVDDFVYVDNNHKRFVTVFVAKTKKSIKFLDGEVAGGKFLSLKKAEKFITTSKKIHPQLTVCFRRFLKNQNLTFAS
jgi:isopentenyldiphosphate isomerase